MQLNNLTKPSAYIFDVDGTLANVEEYRHFVLNIPKNFDAFHEASISAPPIPYTLILLNKAIEDGHAIIVVTARDAKWEKATAMWLALNHIPSDALFMREKGDRRKDYIIKHEILHKIDQKWSVVHAVDDNPAVIQLWEEHGIPTTIIDGWIPD